MSIRTTDRRRNDRVAAAHPVTVYDRGGRSLLHGRTANVSEGGMLLLTDSRLALRLKGELTFEIALPGGKAPRAHHHHSMRLVRYLGRVARVEEIGQVIAVAVELIGKVR
jgi:c-di-GMP-binding flagellar brake protein YcgR